MKLKDLSVKRLLSGTVLIFCALVWLFVLTLAFGKRLTLFTSDLCQTLDHMINGNETPKLCLTC